MNFYVNTSSMANFYVSTIESSLLVKGFFIRVSLDMLCIIWIGEFNIVGINLIFFLFSCRLKTGSNGDVVNVNGIPSAGCSNRESEVTHLTARTTSISVLADQFRCRASTSATRRTSL